MSEDILQEMRGMSLKNHGIGMNVEEELTNGKMKRSMRREGWKKFGQKKWIKIIIRGKY